MRQIADSGSVYIFTVAIRSGVYGVPRSCDILREALVLMAMAMFMVMMVIGRLVRGLIE